MRTYRVLLALYPRTFRREYADDMVALLEAQIRDEPTLRVVGRTALDLLVTIPVRHLEVHMPHSSTTPLVITFIAAASASAVFGGLVGLLGAMALFLLAALVWRHNRPVEAASDSRWWKLLLGGSLLLGALVVVTSATGELPSGGWYVAMATLFASFGMIGSGIVLGVAGRVRLH